MASKGPLPGPYAEFFLPIKKDATKKQPDVSALTNGNAYHVVYIKEAVGLFLMLPACPNRVGKYKNGDNVGREFNYRKQRASQTYTIILKPNTPIQAYNTDPSKGSIGIQSYQKNSVSICVPPGVTVSEMIAWLANPTIVDNMVGDDFIKMPVGGYNTANNYSNIIALITPSDRRHSIRCLTATGQPPVTAPVEPATNPILSPPGGVTP
jgi:hypothetical protein